ncbi:FXSXX-COOH protein [Streptomyces sp. SID5785]|uniref:FxSxx-COOH cyclophane-containing RiPP peptide n=1 Tax=Streptomyces sp. SID5785 TaxID=2690309 RepID=UPI00136101FA|nr:FxSxx-COOH cyclophane-containing RiPP peptide [Streptomyces sp. SID5785]MZD03710.1 FXSXX-COOH protein [Streptomyces sp. SID5785]
MAVTEDHAAGEPEGVAPPDAESPVLDISGLSLEDVATLPPSALGSLLRRLLDARDAGGDAFVTGHLESK